MIIFKFFWNIILLILNALYRMYELIFIKLFSVKGVVLALSFYLTLQLGSDIWAFVAVAGWIVHERESNKGKINKDKKVPFVGNWIEMLKERAGKVKNFLRPDEETEDEVIDTTDAKEDSPVGGVQ